MSTIDPAARQRSRAFARVIGPYVAVFACVYAIRLPALQGLTADLFTSPTLTLMLGALMLGGGLVIIGGHRSWRGPLAVSISLFGWFVAIRGFLLIALPTTIESGVDTTLASPATLLLARLFFVALAVFGLALTWAGWFPELRLPRRSAG